MVLTLDGDAKYVSHLLRKAGFINDFKFATAVDQNKCLKQVELPISIYTVVPIAELPSCIRTVGVDGTPMGLFARNCATFITGYSSSALIFIPMLTQGCRSADRLLIYGTYYLVGQI